MAAEPSAFPILIAALAAATDTTVLIAVADNEANPDPQWFVGNEAGIAHVVNSDPGVVANFLAPRSSGTAHAFLPTCTAPSRTAWGTSRPLLNCGR